MKLFVVFLLGIIFAVMPVAAKKHIMYVGTYTTGMADGIFVYSFNDQSGKLVNLKMPAVCINPSFLAISANKQFLYAVSESDNLGIDRSGGVSAFSIDKTGHLSLLNQVLTNGANPCHVCLSPDGKKLVASNYSSGNLSLFNVLPDGRLSEIIQKIQHVGSGPFKGRQDEPHAHSARFDASGKYLFAADLGIDEFKIYQIGAGAQPLSPYSQPFVKFAPGSGPRHFDFSADEQFIYVTNELSSTITVLIKYGGVWKEIQTIKTLPKAFSGENWSADIHLSANGRFVYSSNRGHNSIAVFKRDQLSGRLQMIQTISVEGNWPRNFTLDPSGAFLLAANQKSNDITVFRIDETTGMLRFTGIKIPCQSPVCLQFLR